jgi:hypothetical protein
MARQVGKKLTNIARRRAIRQLQSLLAAGVADDEARQEVGKSFDVSERTTRTWLRAAYCEMAAAAEVDRRQLVGLALKRRRMAAARALRDGDTRTFLAACDSESRLLGLDAPARTQHVVMLEHAQSLSRSVVETIADFYRDDPAQRARFVAALRTRLNAQLAQRPEKLALMIESGDAGEDDLVEASVARTVEAIADVAPTGAPAPDAPPPD